MKPNKRRSFTAPSRRNQPRGLFAVPARRVRAISLPKRAGALLLVLAMTLQLTGADWIVWLASQFSQIVQAAEFTPPELPGCADDSEKLNEDNVLVAEVSYDWYNAQNERYDGKTGTVGSEENPYLIQNGAEMKGLSNIVNGTAIGYAQHDFAGEFLTFKENTKGKVIDLICFSGLFYLDEQGNTVFKRASSGYLSDYVGWMPIGVDSAHPFRGTFRAPEGFVVKNLAVNAAVYNNASYEYDVAGLFGYVDFSGGGSIEGFHLVDAQVAGAKQGVAAGALAGNVLGVNLTAASFVNCSVAGREGEQYAPFTVSTTKNVYVEVSDYKPSTDASKLPNLNNTAGGLLGKISVGTLSDGFSVLSGCSAQGTVTAISGAAGGLVGAADAISADGCSFSGSVSLSGNAGKEWGIGGMVSFTTGAARFFSCAVDAQISSTNAASLQTAMGGLIGRAPNLEAQNCSVTGALNTTASYTSSETAATAGTGGIAGYVTASALVKGCDVGTDSASPILLQAEETLRKTKGVLYAGGVLGRSVGVTTISDCTAFVDMDFSPPSNALWLGGHGLLGGIVGAAGSSYSDGSTITGCTVEGRVFGKYSIGGIAGKTFASISDCSFFGSIQAEIRTKATGIGGLVGDFLGETIDGCSAQADIAVPSVDMNSGVGGIAGRTGSNSNESGDAPTHLVSNSLFNGSILAGDLQSVSSSIKNNSGVGGVVGITKKTTVEQCVSSVDLTWTVYKAQAAVGGIVGRTESVDSVVTRSFSAGLIRAVSSDTSGADQVECYIGGIVGAVNSANAGMIADCYSSASLWSDSMACNIGGLLGGDSNTYSSTAMVKNSYFSGFVLSPWGGSLAGRSFKHSLTSCYYDRTLSPNAFAAYANTTYAKASLLKTGPESGSDAYLAADASMGRTTEQLTDGELPAGFEAGIWTAQAGSYPRLSWSIDASASPEIQQYAQLTALPALSLTGKDDASLRLTSSVVPLTPGGDFTSEWRDQAGALLSEGAHLPADSETISNATSFINGQRQWTLKRSVKLLKQPAELAGLGLQGTPFVLSTPRQLAVFADYVNQGGGYLGVIVKQTADIDLNELGGASLSLIGTSASPFCGRFIAGQGAQEYFTISNFRLDALEAQTDETYGGLFGSCAYGVLDGVSLVDATITASAPYAGTGTIAGYAQNMSLFACSSEGADVTVNTADQSGQYYRGGLVGRADRWSAMSYSWFAGNVQRADSFGGLIGQLAGASTITASYVAGNIGDKDFTLEESRDNVGGLVGTTDQGTINQTTITTSYFIGNLIGRNNLGGIVGNAGLRSSGGSGDETFSSCYFIGSIDGADRVGGLIGNGYTSSDTVKTFLQDCYFVGQITSSGLAGALSGTTATLTNCYFNREISGSLKARGSDNVDETGAGKSTAELTGLTGTELAFTGKNYTRGSSADPHYPSLIGAVSSAPGDASAPYRERTRRAAAASVASLYDFLSGENTDNNAYVVKHEFTVTARDKVQITEPYNIAAGFTAQVQGSATTYTPIGDPEPSLYPFVATYSDLPFPSLSIRTKVIIVPFETGNGTKDSPFEIPDEEILIAFRNYINQGSGAHGAYYRLTSKDNAIYDLSTVEWVPVAGVMPESVLSETDKYPYYERATVFDGHFDGNGRTIKGLHIGSEDSPTPYIGKENLTVGLFGNVKSGSVYNLTLDATRIFVTTDSDYFYAGAVAGEFDSSMTTEQPISEEDIAQQGIIVTDAVVSVTGAFPDSAGRAQLDVAIGGAFGLLKTSGSVSYSLVDSALSYNETSRYPADVKVGGIAGKADCDADTLLLHKVVADADITGPGLSGSAGGLIGQVVAPNQTSERVVIQNAASYGSLSGYLDIGGAAGRNEGMKNPITNFTSTADLLVPVQGHAGGIYGYAEQFDIDNCVYGGRVEAEEIDSSTYVGGLVGYYYFNAAQVTNSNLQNSYYDSTLNSALGLDATGDSRDKNLYALGFYQTNAWVDPDLYTALIASLRAAGNAKPTYELAAGAAVDEKWTSAFILVDGLYPYPQFVGADATSDAIENVTVANSVALYYVWAAGNPGGAAHRERLSSSYVRYDGAGLVPSVSDGRIAVTDGQKRVVATRKEETEITARVKATVNGTDTLGKTITFIPDNTPTGKPDISFLVANPTGDRLCPNSEVELTPGEVTFTLYNADQLAGLSLLASAQAANPAGELFDEHDNYYKGDMSVLGFADRKVFLGADIDCAVYSTWTPIGQDEAHPFSGSLDGAYYTVSGLSLTGEGDAQGLFGYAAGSAASTVTLSNVGLVGTSISNDTATYLGSLLGFGGPNTAIEGCFSSVRVVSGKASGPVYTGGLAGSMADGTSLISNSFFTGSVAVNTLNEAAYAGGFVGEGGYLRITGSYTAGFVDAAANHYGGFAGKGESLRFTGAYLDANACGQINAVGTGRGEALSIATANLTAAADGERPAQLTGLNPAEWTFTAGLYPLVHSFALPDNSISVIPVTLEAHARSTTYGHISYPGAAFEEGEPNKYLIDESTKASFTKKDSGVTFVKLTFGTSVRLIYMDLKCWYEEPDGNVYTISNAYELQELAYLVNGEIEKISHTHAAGNLQDSFENKIIRLAHDIDLSALENFTPVGTAAAPFKGTLNGEGHTVSNIALQTDNRTEIGLFGATSGAAIQNVGLSGGRIEYTGTGAPLIGGLVGRAENTEIQNCFNATEIVFTGTGASAGGIAGTLLAGENAKIVGSFNMAVINYTGEGEASVGGIAGHNDAEISFSYNTGMLQAGKSAAALLGGISGGNTSTVKTCYNSALLLLEIGSTDSIAPIAQGGETTGCAFNSQFSDGTGEAPTVSFVGGSELCGSGLFTDGWVKDPDGGHYPQLEAFATGSEHQQAASLVSSEAALLKKAAGSPSYKEFDSVAMNAEGTVNGELQPILVQKKPTSSGGSFEITTNAGTYTLLPADEGPTTMTVSIDLGGATFERDILFLVLQMLNVRYQFDFSGIPQEEAGGRSDSFLTESTWMAAGKGDGTAGDPYQVSTAQDLLALSEAVNGGTLRKGAYVNLMGPIDLTGVSLAPIGTEQHPFTGTFDGNGYVIHGLAQSGGTTGLFGTIDKQGKVKRVGLEGAAATLSALTGNQVGGLLAAVNNGSIQSCYVRGLFTVRTPVNPIAQTRAGCLAGVNNGRITGCYFRPDENATSRSAVQSSINRSVESQTYFGILVGLNAGTMSGCYHTSDMATGYNCIMANGIAGYSNEGGILNCFYDNANGTIPYPVAYTGPDGDVAGKEIYSLDTPEFKTADTALQLSFDLYLATYQADAGKNDGYPSLDAFELVRWQFPAFGEDHTILFNLQNNLKGSQVNTVMNAVCAYDGYTFPRFGKIPVNGSIIINLPDLPKDMGFTVEAVAYGYNEDGTKATPKPLTAISNNSSSNRLQKAISTTVGEGGSMPDKAYQINVTIKLAGGVSTDPWGVRQKWNSATMSSS